MIAFLNEAERSCDWVTAKSVLEALETVGMHAESSLHMLLPTLTRLISPDGSPNTKLQKKCALASLSNLVPRIPMSNHASMVVHALRRVIESGPEELKAQAAGVLCAVAQTLGSDYMTFVPMTDELLARNLVSHRGLESTILKISRRRAFLVPQVTPERQRGHHRRHPVSQNVLSPRRGAIFAILYKNREEIFKAIFVHFRALVWLYFGAILEPKVAKNASRRKS